MPSFPSSIARHLRLIGVIAILICLGTWGLEWVGAVKPCIYCRVERSVIGMLGALLLFGRPTWWTAYGASVLALFGASTVAVQHFNGWKAIQDGSFEGFMPLYANGFVLSAAALVIIVGLWMLISGSWQSGARTVREA